MAHYRRGAIHLFACNKDLLDIDLKTQFQDIVQVNLYGIQADPTPSHWAQRSVDRHPNVKAFPYLHVLLMITKKKKKRQMIEGWWLPIFVYSCILF